MYAQVANGIYLFKNGRFIEKITDGPLYERVIGARAHHYHNGTIIIVNIKGQQNELPVTSTTKNSFLKTTPLFDEMLDIISTNIIKPDTRGHLSEETSIQNFKQDWENRFKSMRVNATVTCEKVYDISDVGKSPPIDLVVEWDNRILLYEAKDLAALQLSYLEQIHTNWLCAKKVNQNKQIECIILLKAADTEAVRITEQHKAIVALYKEVDPSFDLQIQNYKGLPLYNF
jgi:hypothetical protein